MRCGEVWTASRFGHDRKVVIVGHDSITRQRKAVLVVPISDVMPAGMVEPTVSDSEGTILGVAQVPRVGEISKEGLTAHAGVLAPTSVEKINVALRLTLDL